MRSGLAKNCWLLALRGVLAVLFGLAALAWVQVRLNEFVLLFGTYLLIAGLVACALALRAAERSRRACRSSWRA